MGKRGAAAFYKLYCGNGCTFVGYLEISGSSGLAVWREEQEGDMDKDLVDGEKYAK